MEVFYSNITSFPTAIYTVLVLVSIGFWLLNLIGLFNFDGLDIDVDIDIDSPEVGGFTTVLINLGLTAVPFTLVLSLLNIIAWAVSYYASLYGLVYFEPGLVHTLIGATIFIVSFAIALPITAYAIQPLRSLFTRLNDQGTTKTLIGEICTIRTSRVDENFGEAECCVDGLSHIIKVRTTNTPLTKLTNQQFKHGDKAVVIEHDKELGLYHIISEAEFNA